MDTQKHYRIILMALLSIFLLTSLVNAESNNGKIPVTTSSQEALDYFIKGRDLSEKLRVTESRDYFEKAIAADPKFALGYVYLAFAQTTFPDYFDNFNKARALVDHVSEGERYWILGVEAGNNNDPMKQRKYFQKLVEAYPQDERALNLLGNNYFGQQEYELAIKEYNKAIAINPDYSQSYNQLGYSYRFLGEYDKARKTFEKYIELIPDDPNPYDSYAELLMKMGEYEESIKHYNKALAINHDFMASHIGIATNYNFLGEHEKARSRAQTMLELAGDNGQRRGAYFAMIVSYVDEGKYDMALSTLDEMFRLAQMDNDFQSMANDMITRGTLLMEMGEYDKAAENFAKSMEYRRQADVSAENLAFNQREQDYYDAFVALMKGDYSTATAKSNTYMKAATTFNNPFQIRRAHQLAGMIALEQKDYNKAIEHLEKSSLQNPYNIYRLAQAFAGLGKTERSNMLYNQAAKYNSLNDINLAFIRDKARQIVAGVH